VGLVLIGLSLFHGIQLAMAVAALLLGCGVLYSLYMTIGGALYRAGRQDIGGLRPFHLHR
jgi:hypothetical protein